MKMIEKYPSLEIMPGRNHSELDVVLSSRLIFSRNLSSFSFPDNMESEEKERCIGLLGRAFNMAGMDIIVKNAMDFESRERILGLELAGRAYMVDDNARFAFSAEQPLWARFFLRDHVLLGAVAQGLALDELYPMLEAADSRLYNALHALGETWAFDHLAGYLQSDVLRCGSGLGASISLHLPALVLTGLAEQAFRQAMEAGFTVEGDYSPRSISGASVFGIALPETWREPAAEAIERLGRAAMALAEYERMGRKEYFSQSEIEMLDLSSRSLGVLLHAFSIGTDEALECISALRMGKLLGLVDGLELEEFSFLVFLARTRPAILEGETEASARARVLRSALKGATMNKRVFNV